MTTTTPDEYDALRTIVKTLEAFGPDEQNRILRWAAEKLRLAEPQRHTPATGASASAIPPASADVHSATTRDIRSFVEQKKPKNDSQFAAVVAYYHRFEAPEKKDSITQTDLLDACRKANYPRPPAPGQTLRNAVNAGLLDKAGRGAFAINSVGENLVAVTLPGEGASPSDTVPRRRSPRRKHGSSRRESTAKKATAKK